MAKDPKPSPKTVIREFLESLRVLENGYDVVAASLGNSIKNGFVENLVAEQFATSIAILWEGFIHDVLVSYVLKSHKKYLNVLKKRIVKSVTERFGPECGNKIVFAFGTPRAISDIELLLDPKGWNLAANSGDKLAAVANDLLKSSAARKFSLDSEDRFFVNFLVALRNFLAHRSAASRKVLIAAIRKMALGGKNGGLHAQKINISKYLLHTNGPTGNRLKVIFARVRQIAEGLG